MQGFSRQTVYDAVPIGSVLEIDQVTTPAGFLLCDGSAVSRITYADLFTAIGTSFGVGDGSTTFNLPNLPYSTPPPANNYLLNGGYDLCQRTTVTPAAGGNPYTPVQTSGSAADTTHDGYGADRWKCAFQTATLKYQRIDTQSSLESGITSRFYGNYVQQTGAGKFVVYQPLEGTQTLPLAGQTITWQCKMKTSSAKTIRMAVLQLNSSGTIDTLPATIVSSSTWGSNTVDPTWATNIAVVGSVVSQSVTTSWKLFSVTVTAPSNAKNLVVAIWTDSQFSVSDSVSMTEASLLLSGGSATPWSPRPLQQEIQLCQRFFEKSMSLDTATQATFTVGIASLAVDFGGVGLTSFITMSIPHRVVKRSASPSFKIWDATGTAGVVSEYTGGVWTNGRTPNATYCDDCIFKLASSSTTTTAFVNFNYWVDAEL